VLFITGLLVCRRGQHEVPGAGGIAIFHPLKP